MAPPESVIVATRRQLHGIAENLIAGPQYRDSGTIRMAVRPDGFTGTVLPVAVQGTSLVWPDGEVPLSGPASGIAAAAGIPFGPPPVGVYQPVAPLPPDSIIDLDPAAADVIYRCLYAGGTAVTESLKHGHPVLWPEHFDVGAEENEVNYGVAAGDDVHPLPYAYVAPWGHAERPRPGTVWNAPFGALLPVDLDADIDTMAADIVAFIARVQREL